MQTVIDGIIFSLQRHGGISVYFQELIRALSSQGAQARLTLETPLRQEPQTSAGVTVHLQAARRVERYRSARVPANAAVFHSSYYRQPDRVVPTVVTVHDFTYERFMHGPARWLHVAQKHAAIRSAQAVICISESTRQDLLEWVGETPGQQVHVVHNGVSQVFRPLGRGPNEGRPFVLFVGDRRGYKNFALALASLAMLPEIELRCVGGGDLRPEELAGLAGSARARVRHLGYVGDEALNEQYNQALCLVYPSRYEGFGIPVLEAMRAGCPVVCIECKAVLEIGGDALMVAQADEPRALADAILACTGDSTRATLVRRGLGVAAKYSWQTTHRRTQQIYAALGADQRSAT